VEFTITVLGKGVPLEGASFYRSNGDYLKIVGTSTNPDYLPLNSATLELEIKNYSTGVAVNQAVKSSSGAGDDLIEIPSQSTDSLTAYAKLVPDDFASITATSEVELNFKLDVTTTKLAEPITVLTGKFSSIPDLL